MAGVYEDPDSSGGDEDREILWEAVTATRRGYVLVVHDLDRLARRLDTQIAIEEELRQSGASLEIVTGTPGGEDPLSTLIRHILAAVAEFDRRVKAKRTSIHMKRMQASGRSMGGVPPYGKSARGKMLVDNPAELAVVERICQLRESGVSYHGIAKSLDAENAAVRGGKWHATSVRRIYLRRECSA